MTQGILILVALLLVAGNAVFVAAETALVTVERAEVDAAAERGDGTAARIGRALRSLSTQLSGAQLGITVTSLAIGFIAEPAVATLLHSPLGRLGVPEDAVEPVAIALALVLASVVQMVLGELVPKNLAVARPLATARVVIGAQATFTALARPVIAALNGTANRILRAIGVEPTEELRSARTPSELTLLVGQSASEGLVPPRTAELLVRSLAFGGKTAHDVMTPRVQVHFVAAGDPVARVIQLARATGHSRFPVTGTTRDEVVGLVHVKHAVSVDRAQRRATPVESVMVDAVLVPPTMHLDPLLDLLQARGLQLAVVVDEYGGTDGIVTFEDLVEELVGDVIDEHDEHTANARRRRDGSWLLDGALRIDEVASLTGVDLPTGDYETVAGLLQSHLGRLGKVRDTLTIDGTTLRIQRMDHRRIDRVVMIPPASSDGAP